MSQLIVRNLDDSLVLALKRRAARHGRSAEAQQRSTSRGWHVPVIGLLLASSLGCGHGDPARPDEPKASPPVEGVVVEVGRCQKGAISPDAVKVDYQFDATTGSVAFQYTGLILNCCPDPVGATADVHPGSIRIAVRDAGACDCMCPFDVKVRIEGIEAAPYRVVIQKPSGKEISFDVDFRKTPSGSHPIEMTDSDRIWFGLGDPGTLDVPLSLGGINPENGVSGTSGGGSP